jgi:hypothetical protein
MAAKVRILSFHKSILLPVRAALRGSGPGSARVALPNEARAASRRGDANNFTPGFFREVL